MKLPTHTKPSRQRTTGHRAGLLSLALVAAVCATPAAAQRLSLAERVAALEQRAASSSGNVEVLNQITQLRNELRDLRSQIEQLQRQQEQQAGTARSQYLDLDSRLVRLEGGSPVAPHDPAAAAGAAGATESVTLEVPADSIATDSPPPATMEDSDPSVYGDPGALAKGQNEYDDYLAAFAVLKSGDYVGSARAFQDFMQRYPGGTYAPNALYWLGESYYVTQNYALAQQQFQTLLDRYPTHDKAPGALLKVGLAQYGQDQYEAASATLAEVVARYPGSDAARTAEDRLRAMQLTGIR